MSDLTTDQKDLLQQLKYSSVTLKYVNRQSKVMTWFKELEEKGYLTGEFMHQGIGSILQIKYSISPTGLAALEASNAKVLSEKSAKPLSQYMEGD